MAKLPKAAAAAGLAEEGRRSQLKKVFQHWAGEICAAELIQDWDLARRDRLYNFQRSSGSICEPPIQWSHRPLFGRTERLQGDSQRVYDGVAEKGRLNCNGGGISTRTRLHKGAVLQHPGLGQVNQGG